MNNKRSLIFLAVMALAAVFVFALPTLCSGVYSGLRKISEERIAKKIMKSCSDYKISRTKTSVVYFTEKDEQYARVAESLIKTYLPLLQADFGHDAELTATLVIYPIKEDMYAAIGYTPPERGGGRKTREPMGAYASGVLVVLSPSCRAGENGGAAADVDAFISTGPIVHELSHLVLDKKANGNYPDWFSEGAALYYENKYTGFVWDADNSSSKATYRELADGFKYLDESESYRKSYEIIKYIAEVKGESTLKNIYERLEKGKGVENVLKKELDAGLEALDGL